jgi:hypothetical protein
MLQNHKKYVMKACSALDTNPHLFKAHVLGILAEALTAHVQAVLPNDAPLIRADAAACDQSGSEIQQSHDGLAQHARECRNL